ncbi:MAG: type II secretion system major pseudopilin GspG [Nitrospinota bacterium]|nr:type II secretion system major pseudopilin GspG [Nitrospinota bacterium]
MKLIFKRPTGRSGFTLLEILVVVAILGILATVVVTKIFSKPDEARVTTAIMGIKSIEGALEMYKLDNGVYPSTDQGLRALVEKPTSNPEPRKWNPEGYLKKVPKDPWGGEYLYLSPGAHGDFDLISLGSDGENGGEGFAADINNWELD